MAHLSVATVIEKSKIASNVAFVILLEIDVTDPNTRDVVETLRIARNSEDILFGGNLYRAANFSINIQQKDGEEPSVSCTARDPMGTITSLLEAYAGGMNSPVRMIVVNTGRLDKPAEMVETFQITTTSFAEQNAEVNITLGSENPLSVRFPLHYQYRDRCCWRYKSLECGYVGSMPKCSYTLEGADGCRAHSNTLHFGGIPGLVIMNI